MVRVPSSCDPLRLCRWAQRSGGNSINASTSEVDKYYQRRQRDHFILNWWALTSMLAQASLSKPAIVFLIFEVWQTGHGSPPEAVRWKVENHSVPDISRKCPKPSETNSWCHSNFRCAGGKTPPRLAARPEPFFSHCHLSRSKVLLKLRDNRRIRQR